MSGAAVSMEDPPARYPSKSAELAAEEGDDPESMAEDAAATSAEDPEVAANAEEAESAEAESAEDPGDPAPSGLAVADSAERA